MYVMYTDWELLYNQLRHHSCLCSVETWEHYETEWCVINACVDRRRPEITILSAEPLPSNTWFPGASGGFPPAPPPAPPSWSAASGSVQVGCSNALVWYVWYSGLIYYGLSLQLPPPSYEQVIKEKTREQNLPSTSSSSSSSSPPPSHRSTSTIATQTDTDSPDPQSPAVWPGKTIGGEHWKHSEPS